MGGCIGSCLATCACEGVSRACKSCCPATNSKTPSLVPYFVLLFITTLLAVVARYWGEPLLIHLKVIDISVCDSTKCLGFAGVYRLMFSLAIFFLVHALLLYFVRSCAKLDRSNWLARIVFFIALLVAAWYIPNSFYDPVYVNIARVLSLFFIISQVILFIHFAYNWNESWTSDEKGWHNGVLAVSLLFFIGSLILLIFAFLRFTGGETPCRSQNFMISWTLIMTLAASILSVSSIAVDSGKGGVLPASCITIYCYYLLWSALASDPSSCNTFHGASSMDSPALNITHVVLGVIFSCVSVTYAGYSVSKMDQPENGAVDSNEQQLAPASSAGSASSANELKTPQHSGSQYHEERDDDRAASATSAAAHDDDNDDAHETTSAHWTSLARRHARFHLVMFVACLYLSMVLTDWSSLDTAKDEHEQSSTLDNIGKATWDQGIASMWIKISSGWVAVLLYVWTLVAPRLFPDRDFS